MTTEAEPLTGLELAVAVAEGVMGWDTSTLNDKALAIQRPGEPWQRWEPWHDIRAAWDVVEHLKSRCWRFCIMEWTESEPWRVILLQKIGNRDVVATGQSESEAILRAALATVKGEADAN